MKFKDGSGMTGTSTLYVTINNINEHPPVFTSGAVYAFSFDEDTAPGTAINTVSAPDADSGGADGTVDYIIDSGKATFTRNLCVCISRNGSL